MSGTPAPRGSSNSQMREAVCKDCLREERAAQLGKSVNELPEDFEKEFVYNERSAQVKLDRGQTRSDRCKRHRARHRVNIQGMAVPYIDLKTVGEAVGAHDEQGPTGPFGGLGPMPEAHKMAETESVDLGKFGFGMDEQHIHTILGHLANSETRILVVKAGTGTGKSTYMPYRLLDPPDGAAIALSKLGPIIVTEPRVQATTGVAGFVGSVMSGAGGVGPGFPVGFQVSGDRAHDDACQLVYVTDGTMINWLREGRLSTIGTVIVDEAHERSTNIDFIMGYLKKAIDRYPHLRVIVTSATFDAEFYRWYFGGPGKVEVVDVPAVKTIGYGFPLFPDLDAASPGGKDLTQVWRDVVGDDLPLRQTADPADAAFVTTHFQQSAPPLKANEVAVGNEAEIGWVEDLQDTTTKLLPLRYMGPEVPVHQWKERMPKVLGEYMVKLVKGLDAAGIYGDVLGFLPTSKSIDEAVAVVREGLGLQGDTGRPAPDDIAAVYPLLSTLEADLKTKALAAQGKGDLRKIVISTNLAETSLTVEGVRFVVDTGLIAQSEWDPGMAQGGIPTKPHSQSGIRQRWGRVGRKSPGWVFPLYTKQQFLELAQDTPPGSARSNLEQLIMTAKLGGIDDVVNFDWPAKYLPPEDSGVVLDDSALEAREIFLSELARADDALKSSGAVDSNGDPTSFGKELSRSPGLGTTASAIAIMHADRLACVPEVVTVLKLLDGTSMVGAKNLLLDGNDWPDEWRLEAAERHRALATGCQDDAELVLQVMAVWERTAPGVPPWEPSAERELWARRWWINHDLLVQCAQTRREVLEGLSPAMKEEVKRFVEPALVKRARGAISRAMASLEFREVGDGVYRAVTSEGDAAPTGVLGNAAMLSNPPTRMIPLKRTKPTNRDHAFLSNIVTVEPWALASAQEDGEAATSTASAIDLLVNAAASARPDTARDTLAQLQHVWPAGMRVQLRFAHGAAGTVVAADPIASVAPVELPSLSSTSPEETDVDGGDEGEAEATIEDAAPELDTSWPTPAVTEPDPDMHLELVDVEDHERSLLACQDCHECRQGNLDGCLDRLAPVDATRAADELSSWRERATRYLDVSRPRVHMAAGEATDDAWYEVVGYDVTGTNPGIRLRPDWRPSGVDWSPARQPHFRAGQLVEVEVGHETSDHRGALRVFTPVGGGNRFVLREAQTKPEKQDESHQLAVSLHRGTQGLLASLKSGARLYGHVIPRPQDGCSTITFLPLLSAHWNSKQHRYERLADVNGFTNSYYPAVIHAEPNESGYVTARSLLSDSDRGISHLFGIRAHDPGERVLGLDEFGLDSRVVIQVRRATVRLSVGGLPTDGLLRVLENYPGAFHPPSPASGPEGDSDGAPVVLAELDLVPKGWQLANRGPVPGQAAQDLADLNPASREWLSDCWYFWARSHHVLTAREDGIRPAPGSTALNELAADQRILAHQDRRQLAVASATASPTPLHWAQVLNRDAERIAALLGADSIFHSGSVATATFGSAEAAQRGGIALARLLTIPAAAIAVPDGVAGMLIGKGGQRVTEALSTEGVFAYNFDNRTSTLSIVAEPSALTALTQSVLSRTTGATGTLRLASAADNGRLIGKGGSIKNALLSETGCTYANPVAQNSAEWSVQGPTARHVLAFMQRAASVVSCTGEVTDERTATVTDLVSGRVVTQVESHQWTYATAPEVEVVTEPAGTGTPGSALAERPVQAAPTAEIRSHRAEGATVEQAVLIAAAALGVDSAALTVTIIREPRRNVFGGLVESAIVDVARKERLSES
ncbi:MAG: hypothetical protein CMH84_15345 [Nocardioides sp.]|nr:hypothetical protein [Nocardioides sp.]